MKNFFKKSLALLLVLSMFSTLPMVTFAETEAETEKTLYDFGEAFDIVDGYDFSAANVYQEVPLVYANSEESSSPWKAGLTAISTGEFTYLTHASRFYYGYRSPEDTTHNGTVGMSFGTGVTADSTGAYKIYAARNGYSFDLNNYAKMTPGTTGSNRSTLRFVVPRDGVVNPRLSLYDETRGSYDGVFFKVYKKSGDAITEIYGGDYTSAGDGSTGWEIIPEATAAIYDDAEVSVSANDEIVLMFDMGANTYSDDVTLRSYQIEYLEQAEEVPAKDYYNFSEAFEVDMTNYSFEGASAENTTVYQNLPLKNANSEESTSPWKVGYFKVSNNNAFTFFDYMSRSWYTGARAPEDTVSPQTWETRLAFGTGTAYKGPSGEYYGWQVGSSKIGYSFASDTTDNAFPGAFYNTYANTRNGVRFVVPKAGLVKPTIKLVDKNRGGSDGVLFKIYKQSGTTQTPVIGGDYASGHLDTSAGWDIIPEGTDVYTRIGTVTSVSAGDEIVLIFDSGASQSADEFCIYSYEIEYVDPVIPYETETYLSYEEGKINTVDLTRTPVIDGLDGTIAYSLTDAQGLLTATSTPGFYTLTGVTNYADETKGTPAVLTATYTPTGAAEPTCTTSTNIYVGALKTSYDYSEGFAIDVSKYSFEGYAAENTTVYQNLSEGLKYANSEESTSPWKYGYYQISDGSFVCSTHLSKGWYTTDRAPEDTVSPASRDTVLSFGSGSTYKGPSGSEYGWQISGTTIGSSFGDNMSTNSFSGDYYVLRSQSAVRFVAPRAGLVTPRVELLDDKRGGYDGVLFKVYKKNALDGTQTAIYGGDYTATRDSSSGWDIIPESTTTYVKEGAAISVAAGDEIVLRFDPYSNSSVDEFSIVSYTIDYLAPIEEYDTETIGYYEEGGKNLLDLTLDKTSATDNGTITYTVMGSSDALVATETPGVYTMTGVLNYADYVKGTPITVVASYYAEGDSAQSGAIPAYTSTTSLYISEAKAVYDFDEAFRIKDYTFTAGNAVADYNAIEAKYENSDTSNFPWKIGYITVSNGNFNYYPYFNRYNSSSRVEEDTVNTSYTKRVGYGKAESTDGSSLSDYAYFGYAYKSDTAWSTYWNAFSGSHSNKERPTLRFIVPRDGVINPVLKLADNVDTEYSGSDGVLFRVYKKSGSATTAIYGGDMTAPMDSSTDWGRIPGGNVLTTWGDAKVAVKAGDEIVLQIDPNEYDWSDEYNFHSYVLNYVDAIASYDEITYATYDAEAEDKTLDLTVEKYVTGGTVEYTKVDTIGALTETETPGVYTLAGVTNYNGSTLSTPVTVTAAYYGDGESSANGDAPICTTTTTVYISSVLFNYEPFGRYTVDTTNLDMAYDTFFLPYYADANERAVYGTIDLDLHERWAGATVTFDKTGYLEYIGDGFVKVTGLYDHTKSAPAAVDSTDIKEGTTIVAKRDENTVGTPIKMTVTAPDGFSKSYYVLTFRTTVQNVEQNGHDVYRWIYGKNSNRINNAVMGFEAVYGRDNAFTFSPMVADPGALSEGAMIALEAAGEKYANSWRGARVDTYNRLGVSTMGESFDISTYGNHIGAVGVAQTFTAPKSGTIELSSFLPSIYPWQSKYIAAAGLSATAYVNLYDENDVLLATLYTETMTPTAIDGVYGAWQLGNDAVYSDRVTGTREGGTLTFDVEKGQKVRVFTEYPDMSALLSWQGGGLEVQRNADPIFTYTKSELDVEITAAGEGEITSSATATIPAIVDGAVYTYFGYDVNGKLVGSGYTALEDGATTLSPSVTGSAAVDYFKVLIWSDLTSLKSVGGVLILR